MMSTSPQVFYGKGQTQWFAHLGKDVVIDDYVKIARPQVISIGDYSRIDDFSIVAGGQGVVIGKFVHLSSYCSVIGGGRLVMEDFSGLSAGCRLITGSDDYLGRCLTNPCIPEKYLTHRHRGTILIAKHAILGTNTVVMPGVTIGEGVATGAGTVVTQDLQPWGIYVGAPARRINDRRSDIILRMEQELMEETYGTDA